MTFIDNMAEYVAALIIAQVPTYFIQRYFFKSIMDKHLDRLEAHIKSKREKLTLGFKSTKNTNP